MTKTFSILFAFLFLAACEKSDSENGTKHLEISNLVTEQENYSREKPQKFAIHLKHIDVPTLALTFETEVKMIDFSRDQEEKVEKALDLIKQVIASEAFKRGILNKTYMGQKRFKDNDGLSNLKIYNKILEAAERLIPSKNNQLDVELELYLDNRSPALAYTFTHVKRIWMNKKFFNNFEPYQVAGNIFHEWLHKLGFKHGVKASSSRKHSVPYAVGYLVRDIARNL
ncbi:MAG TPA: hypothetical protein VNJ08_15000 [Bacteriovoracaceae bacterium]|nr:hypothetical protein [Bacteriovoracaceae bacterium]